MIITCVVGLPGSGKTHFTHTFVDACVVDDLQSLDDLPAPHSVDHLVICDPWLCMPLIRDNAENILMMRYQTRPNWVFFENNAHQCRLNVLHRDDGRKVQGMIHMLSQAYQIPSDAMALAVWKPPSKMPESFPDER